MRILECPKLVQRHTIYYLQAYNIFDMKVVGVVTLGVSIMYRITLGKVVAKASVMIEPDADHVKTSI